MRIMLDTNILVSAIFFPSPQTKAIITEIVCHHQLILCDYVLEELRLVREALNNNEYQSAIQAYRQLFKC